MTYTNKQLIEILVQARDFHLMKTRSAYWETAVAKQRFNVCGSIGLALRSLHGPEANRPKKLAALVKRHIRSHVYLESFLERNLGKKAYAKLSFTDIQTYRFMMVNNMIRMLGGKP